MTRNSQPGEIDPIALAAQLAECLAIRGVPEGMWRVDIAQARRGLLEVDDLLRWLERALDARQGAPV